jgi:predicted adenine nucleotide alpha hydrolase (AANH) superfamily ATPase
MKPKILLHTCCAVCSGYVIQKLSQETPLGPPYQGENFEVVAYFYNPNIHPQEEYLKRKEALQNYCHKNKVKFIEGEYNSNVKTRESSAKRLPRGVEYWLKKVKGLKNEPEGGKRCKVCYKIRLEETARKAKELQCGYFGSTLTISPHKRADIINPIGLEAGERFGIKFYEADWKKQDGFKKACEISQEEGFYRQNYCGCIYSKQ